MEDVNLKVFNMIKGINESKTPAKHVSVDVSLIVENVTQSKNETIISVNVSVKNNKTLQM